MAEIRVMREGRFGDGRPQLRIGDMLSQRAAHKRDGVGFIFCLCGRDERVRIPHGYSFRIGKFARAFRVPSNVSDRFEQGCELRFGR